MAGPGFQILAGAGSGLVGGLLSGMFGIGGAIVLVPLLALALGLDQHQAQGVTLAAGVLPNGLPAVLHYRKRGVPLHWRLVAWMMPGFLPGVLGGAWLANRIPDGPLRLGFAAFLLLLALQAFWTGPGLAPATSRERPPLDPRAGLLIGLVGGLTGGLLGIGGGVVMIPLMVWWLGFTQQEAQLQSMALLLPPLGLPGAMVYAAAQSGLPWLLIGGVAVGFAVGAGLGARLATALPPAGLRRGFGLAMAMLAVLMAWRR